MFAYCCFIDAARSFRVWFASSQYRTAGAFTLFCGRVGNQNFIRLQDSISPSGQHHPFPRRADVAARRTASGQLPIDPAEDRQTATKKQLRFPDIHGIVLL
jgi:hypothetical protein